MKLVIRHLFRDLGKFYVTNFFQVLYQKLIDRFPEFTFEIQNDPSYENNGYGSIYSCMNFSIINPNSKKYILISFFDNWKYHFMKHLGWQPSNMIQFFYPGGFNYLDYFNFKQIEQNNGDIDCPSNIKDIYKTFFYGPYEIDSLELMEHLYKTTDISTTKPELCFRGCMWDFRKQMISNIKDPSILVLDRSNHNLNYQEYLQDLAAYRCALSLPGGTEVCNRDIECFGVGIPIIRPFLNIEYPDPLIPNYHYISCYTDCKYWDGNPYYISYKDFIESLEYYWHKIKNNIEYLNFIRSNARNWFTKNCIINNNIDYILSQINMEKLQW